MLPFVNIIFTKNTFHISPEAVASVKIIPLKSDLTSKYFTTYKQETRIILLPWTSVHTVI